MVAKHTIHDLFHVCIMDELLIIGYETLSFHGGFIYKYLLLLHDNIH